MKKILIIQTAFIGDVILATSLIESIKQALPDVVIDFVLRKGNESLLEGNPHVRRCIVWNKKEGKYKSLFSVSAEIRKETYDWVINLQRFASSGFLTWRSRAAIKSGFKNNPLSFFYTEKTAHVIGNGKHETERNFELIHKRLPSAILQKPKLYPTAKDYDAVAALALQSPYVVMAPSSVWFTKQLPEDKWVELIQKTGADKHIYLVGAPADYELLNRIQEKAQVVAVTNLAGKLSLTASAVLMKAAQMNYVNDSAPLHLASAVNAPVTAFFCSTVPAFGFGPLSEQSRVVEVAEKLDCRPCGLHGYKACPLGHFKCGNLIAITP